MSTLLWQPGELDRSALLRFEWSSPTWFTRLLKDEAGGYKADMGCFWPASLEFIVIIKLLIGILRCIRISI